MEYVFMTRSFWKEINVSEKRVRKLYKAYLGTKDLHMHLNLQDFYII